MENIVELKNVSKIYKTGESEYKAENIGFIFSFITYYQH